MVVLMSHCVCIVAYFTYYAFSFCAFSSQPSAFSSGDPFRSNSPKTKDSGTLLLIAECQYAV